MPQSFSAKKSDFAGAARQIAARILDLARDCDEFASFYFSNTFNSGAAQAIVQDDLVGGNLHLTPAVIGDVVTAAQAVSTAITSGHRDNMRKAIEKPSID